jgi:hypothetical protein
MQVARAATNRKKRRGRGRARESDTTEEKNGTWKKRKRNKRESIETGELREETSLAFKLLKLRLGKIELQTEILGDREPSGKTLDHIEILGALRAPVTLLYEKTISNICGGRPGRTAAPARMLLVQLRIH